MFIQQDPGLERRRRLAMSLMQPQQRSMNAPNKMQGIADIAQKALGAYMYRQGEDKANERQGAFDKTMQLAAGSKPWIDPDTQKPFNTQMEEMARVLAQNPDTAQMAMQMRMQEAARDPKERKILKDVGGYQRYQDTGERLFPEAEKAAKAGTTPSAIQEYEFYKNLSPEDRRLYNLAQRGEKWLNLGGEYAQPGSDQRLQKTVSPEARPEFQAQQEAAKTEAKQFETAKGKWRATETKLVSTMKAAKDRQKVLDDSITKAKGLLSKWTTSYGGMIANLPATESKRLSNLLDTIKANVGFTELQSLRDNSPTGGALGQVSEMENRLLQSVLGSLDQTGDMGDLAETLDTVSGQRHAAIQRMEEAYNMDKDTYGSRIKVEKPGESEKGIGEMSDDELLEMLSK
jgi:hypothetical protein